MLRAARWKCRTQKIAKKSPSGHHRTNLSGYIFATKAHIGNRKKFISSNISLTCSHNDGELRPTSGWDPLVSLGHPCKFQRVSRLGSVTAPTCRSTEANQTLHGVWPSPGLVHYIYIFEGSCPVMEFCQVQNSLCILQVLRSRILVALLHGTWAAGTSQTLRRWTQGATYIRQGDHHVGHWPTF